MPLQTTIQPLSTSTILLSKNLQSDQQASHLSDSDDLIIVDSPAESAPVNSSFGLFLEDRKPDLSLLHREFSESEQSEMAEQHMVLCGDKPAENKTQKTSFSPLEPKSDSQTSSQGISSMESSQVLVTSSPPLDTSSQHATKSPLYTDQLEAKSLPVDKSSSPSVISPPNIQPSSPLHAENIQRLDKSSVTTASKNDLDSTQIKNDVTTHPTSLEGEEINSASVPQEQESPEPGEILSDEDSQKEKIKEESIQKPLHDQRASRQTRVDFSPQRVRSLSRSQQRSPRYRYHRGHSEHRPKQPKKRSRTRKHSNDDLELEKLRKEALESRSKARKTPVGSVTEEKGESNNMTVQHKSAKPANVSVATVDTEQTNQACAKEANKSTSVEVSPCSIGLPLDNDRLSDSVKGKSERIRKSDSPKLSIMDLPQMKACSPLLHKSSSNSSPQTPLTSNVTAFKPTRTVSLPISSGLDGERTVGRRAKLAGSRVGSPYDSPVRSPSLSTSLPTSCSSIKVGHTLNNVVYQCCLVVGGYKQEHYLESRGICTYAIDLNLQLQHKHNYCLTLVSITKTKVRRHALLLLGICGLCLHCDPLFSTFIYASCCSSKLPFQLKQMSVSQNHNLCLM